MAAAIKQEEALQADTLHRQRLMEKRLQEISKVCSLHPPVLQDCIAWLESSMACPTGVLLRSWRRWSIRSVRTLWSTHGDITVFWRR